MGEVPSGFNPKEITNYAPDATPGGPPTQPDATQRAREYGEWLNAQERGERGFDTRGRAMEEVLRTAENPTQVLFATREIMGAFEEASYYCESGRSPYSLEQPIAVTQDRRDALSKDTQLLLSLGIIDKPVRLGNGETEPLWVRQNVGFCIGVRTVMVEGAGRQTVYDPDKKSFVSLRVPSQETFGYLGTKVERKILADALDKSYGEMVVRKCITDAWNRYKGNTEYLTGIAAFYFNEWIKPRGMELLFNLPGTRGCPDRTATGVEYKKGAEVGQMIDTAMRLYMVGGLAERKGKMLALMERPGFIQFLFKDNQDQIRRWIGNPEGWVDDNKRFAMKNGKKDAGESKKIATVTERASRGLLTKFGNVWVDPGVDNFNEYRLNVRKFIGNGRPDDPNVILAEDYAYKLFRIFGTSTEFGWQDYPSEQFQINPSSCVVDSDMGTFTSDDRIKTAWPEVFRKLYAEKGPGRDIGPAATLGKYEGFTTDFLDTLTLKNSIGLTRTWYEAMWGYNAGDGLAAENPIRLGEINYSKLADRFMNSYFLRIYMAGQEKTGTYPRIMETSWDPRDLTNDEYYRKFIKAVQVGVVQPMYVSRQYGGYRTAPSNSTILDNEFKEFQQRMYDTYIEGIQTEDQWMEMMNHEEKPAQGPDKGGVKQYWTTAKHALKAMFEAGLNPKHSKDFLGDAKKAATEAAESYLNSKLNK